MKGINKVILVGVCGKDPEVRYSASGTCVAQFSIATNEKYRDKRTNEQVTKTTWHQCLAFAKTAELIGKYMQKGAKTYVEGAIENQTYEKDGEKRYSTKIFVRDFVMLNSFERNDNDYQEQNKKEYHVNHEAHTSTQNNEEFNEDDIPF